MRKGVTMLYEREKAMLHKEFRVKRAWKTGHCKMKIGDILKVIDYGSGSASDYVVFENSRIPNYRFTCGTWFFINNTEIA